ncbi:hypothetical protein [Rhizobium sp. SRDI969]|uniref:hypothetical protein n=1 Tax=Rhizobium sp. SRDI969 TaxID=3138252 RepID=UPI0021A711DD|nr:hypothetical protein [Rhizobium leguminosarum]UWM83215.1 hypothetical protein N2A41_08165 [Rhizobium leguminosarum bv. viciae]
MNMILVGIVMLAAMKFDISTSTAVINFGAFTAFFAVDACVVRYLMKNAGERNVRTIVLLVAVAGALFCASLFYNLDKLAIELGFSWRSSICWRRRGCCNVRCRQCRRKCSVAWVVGPSRKAPPPTPRSEIAVEVAWKV